jgi:ABC-2 type transport system permease protein
MRQFLAFIAKEFRHIARDRWTTIILLVLPVLMLTLFGFAITTEVKNTRVAVYDPSRDGATRGSIESLMASPYFGDLRYLERSDDIEDALRGGEVGLVVVFGERFEESLARGGDAQVLLIADGSDPNTATTLATYASSIVSGYLAESFAIGASSHRVAPQVKLLYNPQMKGAYNFVPGVMGMVIILICAMMTSVSIAREKEKGTMEILLVSPMRPIYIILAKAVPYLVLSLVNFATIIVLSVFMLKVPIAGSFAALVVLSLEYIFLSLSLGLLVSSVANNQATALLVSGMALMIPIVILSGMMFPVENMPLALRALSAAIPARWYIAAVRKIMIKGLGFGSIVLELSILGGMTVLVLAASLRKFKVRLE